MMKTLLTESEVISWTKLGDEFPGCTFNDIKQVERTERRLRLGKEFYDSLVESLVEHEYTEYDASVAYVTGNKVLYNGLIYEAIKDDPSEPVYSTDWVIAAKFGEAKLVELWNEVLGRYLSLRVLQSTVPHLETKISASGLVQLDGQTFNAPVARSGHNPVKRMQEWIENQIQNAWENTKDYLNDNNTETVFEKFIGFKDDDDCNKGEAKTFPFPEYQTEEPKKTSEQKDLNGYRFL